MKKIAILSIFISLGLITLSACSLGGKQVVEPVTDNNTSASSPAELGERPKLIDGDYLVLTENSEVAWYGEMIVGAKHSGEVELKSANLMISNDALSGGELIIDMNSISSDEGLDNLVRHLKSADFFEVEKHDEAKLVVKSSEHESGSAYLVKADLTIKGTTQPIEFTAELKQEGDKLFASSEFEIDRALFDVRYGSGNFFKDLGDKTIRNEIRFNVSLEAVRQD